MNIKLNQKKKQRGFSLVELLVVIAVIGVLASIAMLSLGDVNGVSRKVTAQNKAQRIASLFNAGISAGAPDFLAATNVDQAMNAVGLGANGAGALSSSHFRMAGTSSTMDDANPTAEQAKQYLSWNGTLVYNATGDGGGGSSGSTGGSSAPSGPPPGYTILSGSAVSQIMQTAALFTNNPTISLQGAADWYNDTTGTSGALIVHDGQMYSRTGGEGGGNTSLN